MERAYIDDLNRAYELYFGSPHTVGYHPTAPMLVIDTNDLDFVHNIDHLKVSRGKNPPRFKTGSSSIRISI